MAKKEAVSWTTKLGGNRTLVLGVVIVILCIFTVETYVPTAVGMGTKAQTTEYVKFTVGGRTVVYSAAKYASMLGDWQRCQMAFSGGQQGSGDQFLEELMLAELARDAGVTIPDDTLRDYIRSHPGFSDGSGEFDPKKFDLVRERNLGGISVGAFEEQARMYLLVDHFRKIYANSFLSVSEEDAWRKWKADNPKLEVAYAWAPVAPIRAGLKPEEVKPEEVDAFWTGSVVQTKYRLPPRRAFDAAWVRATDVDEQAWVDAAKEWKDESGLRLDPAEPVRFWNERKSFDFTFDGLSPETVEKLRKENEQRVREEDEAAKKPPAAPDGARGEKPQDAPKDEPKDAPKEAAKVEPAEDLARVPPDDLVDAEKFRRYWRYRVEKEIWLRHLMERVLKDATEAKKPLSEVAEKWSRPGLRIRFHAQEEPLDQYGVEKVPALGGPNCPLRFALNDYGADKAGAYAREVLAASARAGVLEERGWVIFQVKKVLPEEIPPLDSVREKVVAQMLDERARDRARADLDTLRKAAEDARKTLEETAKDKGVECATAGPFNAFSWRPPAPKPVPGSAAPSAADLWKDPDRRTSSVMSRYTALRDTPAGSFGPVLEDVEGTGALYLVQVKARTDPAFDEMTQAQVGQARRALVRERMGALGQEMSYERLKERFSLTIGGEAAPAAEDLHRGGGRAPRKR